MITITIMIIIMKINTNINKNKYNFSYRVILLLLIITNKLKINSLTKKENEVQIQIQNKIININWYSLNFSALDLSVSSKGDLFTIGIDKNLYFYEFRENKFIEISKNLETINENFIKVETNEFGNPFVVTENNEIFTFNEFGNWEKLPGCAKDIGVGENNNIWKVGCNEDILGYGIWYLFFNHKNYNDNDNYNNRGVPSLIYKFINEEEKYKKLKKNYFNGRNRNFNPNFNYIIFNNDNNNNINNNFKENIYKNSFWIRSEASGIKLIPDNYSNIFLIDKERNFKFYKSLTNQIFIFSGIKARDFTISNEKNIFLTDYNDYNIYKLQIKNPYIKLEDFCDKYFSKFKNEGEGIFFIDENIFEFLKLEGKAISISAGPYSQPFIIDREGLIQSSSKIGFN
jgi:hypothetical protein